MALSVKIKALNEHTKLFALCLNTSAAGTLVTGIVAPLTKGAAERDAGTAGALTVTAIGIHVVAQIVTTLIHQEA